MKVEVKTGTGGRAEPLMGMNVLLPEEERTEQRLKAIRRQVRWFLFWHWPGWKALSMVAQLSALLGLFLYCGPLLRLIDPTSASLDTGVVSILLVTVLVVDTFAVSAWLLVRLVRNILPVNDEWDDEEEEFLTKKLAPCLEVKLMVGSFWALVSLCCLVFWVLV